jgi:hypothetical protein
MLSFEINLLCRDICLVDTDHYHQLVIHSHIIKSIHFIEKFVYNFILNNLDITSCKEDNDARTMRYEMKRITADVAFEGIIVSQYDTYRLNPLSCRNIKLKIKWLMQGFLRLN